MTTEIDNCLIYTGEKTCGSCEEFYILSKDYTKCQPFKYDEVDNCFGYTSYKCESCISGYVANSNFYMTNLKDLEVNSLLAVFNDFLKKKKKIIHSPSYCQKTNIDNCILFWNYKICVTCGLGYFIQDNTCKKNPVPIINNCEQYSS